MAIFIPMLSGRAFFAEGVEEVHVAEGQLHAARDLKGGAPEAMEKEEGRAERSK